MNEQQIHYTIGGMLACALWSSVDIDTSEPLDQDYGIEDIHPTATASLIEDLRAFIEANADDIDASGLTGEAVGHDFWLTRNRHGAGFWDRGLGEVGERLTAATRPYGEIDLYVGDDGAIYT
jgi:hypothetical protein